MTPKTRSARALTGCLALTMLAAAGGRAAVAAGLAIYEIQGAGHLSAYAGERVDTRGIVTARAFNGFYLQDPAGDGDPGTSDGIFVFTGGAPAVEPGDEIAVGATVQEFIPGGPGTGNLSITQLGGAELQTLSSGNPLPPPVVIGRSGRIPPNRIVISPDETDPPINLQQVADDDANLFDPGEDGVDFYESLEGMRVTIEEPVAVSATRTFSFFSSELFVLANDGADVAPPDARTARGGISLQPDPDNRGDQNPERVQIQFDRTLFGGDPLVVTVGDRLGDVTGVVGYSFGNFEVNATEPFEVRPAGLEAEETRLSGKRRAVTVATYNVLNLSPLAADDAQRETVANHIVRNLNAPDVVALQEIQDNSGETDDGTTDASLTLRALVNAILAAGGPGYVAFDAAPADGASGGVPGGNIRNAYLYNPQRVELESFRSLTPEVLAASGVAESNAFAGTRDPLQATFSLNGRSFTVINNHLTSRFGSTPVFGAVQPFVQAGEAEREAQVGTLNDYVDGLLAEDRHARIVVLGDLNTFEFTDDLRRILPGGSAKRCGHHRRDDGEDDDDDDRRHDGRRGGRILFNLVERLRDDNVYTFNFEGNSQALDHVFVTKSLRGGAKADIVHVNVDFPRVDPGFGSDHEPIVARLVLNGGGDDEERDEDDREGDGRGDD